MMIDILLIVLLLLLITVNGVVDESKEYLNRLKSSSSSSPPSSSLSSRTSYIIHLNRNIINHDEFHNNILQQTSLTNHNIIVTHKYHEVIYGLVISCDISLDIVLLKSLYGVNNVVYNNKKSITKYGDGTSLPWGLDRLDSKTLPLDGYYHHHYTGYNVDVYIVDTGIDTSHNEFQPLPGLPTREVKNVYSAFTNNLPADIDGQGHGSHVAATVGGKYVGVAPLANLFGVQVLNQDGEGDTSDIVHSLEWILNNVRARGRRSVISMSLGGPCETDNCNDDSLVQASEYLSSQGIVVVVAAGNDACNACKGSPNAAPSAVNVGAIDDHDQIAYFSNYGQCIDVFSPGVEIISACAHTLCGDENYYIPLSGTSMACPHTTGVVAQLLQKDSTATIDDIIRGINCDGSTSNIKLYSMDSISKNLILQVPRTDDISCDLGLGCQSDCSSQGICLPVQNTNNFTCYCNAGYYGANCGYDSDPYCFHRHNYTASFYDFGGDGWDYSNWWIQDASTGKIIDGALDSLCQGSMETHDYCLPSGAYNLGVSRGKYPEEVAWSFCDMQGSAPFTGKFSIDESGTCFQTCDDGAMTSMTLIDFGSDGWDGSYFSIYSELGEQLFGGALPDDSEWRYEICLPIGCSTVLIETNDHDPDEVFFNVCNYTATYHDIVIVCVDSNHVCTASNGSPSNSSCHSNNVPIYLFDKEANGWNDNMYTITNNQGQQVVDITLNSGFSSITSACLEDGCYNLEVGSSSESSSSLQSNEFWSTCGFRGTVPWTSTICLEKKYNLCYGISGCHYFKSYMHESDLQRYFIYDPSSYNQIIDLNNIHGVNDMCSLPDGCYNVFVGAGKSMSGPNEIEICNQKFAIPSITSFCSANNGTTCSIQSHSDILCSAGGNHKIAIPIIQIDTFGDGWVDGSGKWVIKDDQNNIVSQGSLKDGFFAVATSCLQVGFNYRISVSARQYGDEIAVILCGTVKVVGQIASFSVTSTGCFFSSADDDRYFATVDDDFPTIAAPTFTPSQQPTQSIITSVPTAPPTLAATSPVQVVSVPFNITTKLSFFNNDQVLTVSDFYFLVLGIRRVLDLNGYSVWSIDLNGLTVQYMNYGSIKVIKALALERRNLGSSALVTTSISINYFVSKDQSIDSNTLKTSAKDIQNYLEDGTFQKNIDVVLSATVTMTEIKSAEILKVDSSNTAYVQTYNLSSQPVNEYENIYNKIWPADEDKRTTAPSSKLPVYATALIVAVSGFLLIACTCFYMCRKSKKVSVAKYTSLNKSGGFDDTVEKDEPKSKASKVSKASKASKVTAKLRSKTEDVKINIIDNNIINNPIHNSYVPISIQVTDTDDTADI